MFAIVVESRLTGASEIHSILYLCATHKELWNIFVPFNPADESDIMTG